MAWKKLTNEQRRLANKQALNAIKEWEYSYQVEIYNREQGLLFENQN
jgi:hypothetical protein